MASSTYQVFMGMSASRQSTVRTQEGYRKYLSGSEDMPKYVFGSEFYRALVENKVPPGSDEIFLYENGTHTCRETAIGSLRAMARSGAVAYSFSGWSRVCYQTAYFVYTHENGRRLTKEFVDYAMSLLTKFSDIGLEIKFSSGDSQRGTWDNYIMFSFQPNAQNYYTASLLFYMLRHKHILDYMVNHYSASGTVSFRDAMLTLAKGFFTHTLWGDPSNPSAAMGLFAWMLYASIHTNNDNQNGPVNLVLSNTSLTFKNVKKFLQGFYLPNRSNYIAINSSTLGCEDTARMIAEVANLLEFAKQTPAEFARFTYISDLTTENMEEEYDENDDTDDDE